MSTFTSLTNSKFILSNTYAGLTNGMAVVIVVILLILLIEKVILDAYNGKPNEKKSLAFTTGILPLLVTLGVVIFLRMAQILHL